MTLLARAPAFPWGLVIVLGAIVVGCVLDRLPARAWYSRRAFEPRPRTWDELEAELEARAGWETEVRWERPSRPGLEASRGRELER